MAENENSTVAARTCEGCPHFFWHTHCYHLETAGGGTGRRVFEGGWVNFPVPPDWCPLPESEKPLRASFERATFEHAHSRLDNAFDAIGALITRIERVKTISDGKLAELAARVDQLEGVKSLASSGLGSETLQAVIVFAGKWQALLTGNRTIQEFRDDLAALVAAVAINAVAEREAR